MKTYVKMVQAIQYEPGNIEQIKELFNEVNIEPNSNPMVIIDPVTGRWRVQPGDYIVKDFKGIAVYKASRFEEEFEEVTVEDVPEPKYVAGFDDYKETPGESILGKESESKGVSDESQKALKAEDTPKTKKTAEKK